jgi:hypothetical protein
MATTNRVKRTTGINIVIMLYVIDAAISLMLLARGTQYVAINEVGLAADLVAIAGLWSMKRWGAAFTIVASGKGIGQSILTLQIAFLNVSASGHLASVPFWRIGMPWLTIGTDLFIVIYLFKGIFGGLFS